MNSENIGGILAMITVFIIAIAISSASLDKEPTCSQYGCNNKCASDSNYCYLHKPIPYSLRSNSSSSSKSNSSSSSKSNSSSSKTTTTKSSSSSKKYEMPDCDDYDSYDDFMDDWDGYMPDGSDAEDYWENW